MTQTSGIGSNPLAGNLIEKTDRAAQTEKQAKVSQGDIPKAGTVQDAAILSGAGSVLAAAATTSDDVRMDRVEALRSALNSGTYQVPAADVADKLVNHMLE